MGKFRQFLFGTLTGACLVFVALQYHVVQTHQGFRVVPRTPQHSIGLAFIDIRGWDAADWADRPEVARAFVANGSADLVAGSVTEGLMESVSSGSPIDQLRGKLNLPPSSAGGSDSMFDAPGFLPIGKESSGIPQSDFDDLLSTPFPLDPKLKDPLDAAFKNNPLPSTPRASTTVSKRPDLDVNDVFTSGVAGLTDAFQPAASTPQVAVETAKSATSAGTGMSAQQEAELLERMLFGDSTPATTSSTSSSPSSGAGMFEDVTNTLESRAAEAMQRVTSGIRDEANQAVKQSSTSLDRYVRDQVKSSLPESVSGMFNEDLVPVPTANSSGTSVIPEALKALQNGFDPFLE